AVVHLRHGDSFAVDGRCHTGSGGAPREQPGDEQHARRGLSLHSHVHPSLFLRSLLRARALSPRSFYCSSDDAASCATRAAAATDGVNTASISVPTHSIKASSRSGFPPTFDVIGVGTSTVRIAGLSTVP